MALTTCAQRILEGSRGSQMGDAVPEQYWEVVSQYREELITHAAAIVGNAADAEDVVQETFSEALRNPEKLTSAKSLSGWLKSINKTNAMDFLRRKKSMASKSTRRERELPGKTFTTGGMSAVELHDSVARAIEALPANMRTVVVLHFWQHLSCEEIARQQNIPTGTVKWLLSEAALKLHGKLKAIRPDADKDAEGDNK
ncbi:MAG TPA: RNA polymerase sigma factor [Planctomycetota bacterium]|nr:RNA polymerase sigma factor [Planctomycetota bacterium]